MVVYKALAVLGGILLSLACRAEGKRPKENAQKPNIIMIMTDDQDLLMNSVQYQPAVLKQFRDEGTFFERHYCTIAQCCPSRVSLLTGKAAHNTNVTDIRAPYGGYSKFVQQGLNDQWLPLWFQQNGYNTAYVGKLMNEHSTTNYDNPYPRGFNSTDFLIDPGTYIYYNATMQSNHDPPRSLPGQYSTDVVASRAMEMMTDAASSGSPFFLTVAPIGPHTETLFPRSFQAPEATFPIFNPPVPADRHKDLHPGVQVPRGTNFNPAVMNNTSSYFKNLPLWNQTVIDYYDQFYRLRLQALAAVDDLVTNITSKVEELKLLDNTYIIYTSDNGYHIGQHRLPAGKTCAIEEDINVPFFIRGPNIAKNVTVNHPTSHTDIAPTLFHLAGIPLRDDFDGIPMPVHESQTAKLEHVNVEFWGSNLGEGNFALSLLSSTNNNTYKALRLISDDYTFNVLYVVWCTNERELYDMNVDSGQNNNIAVNFTTSGQNRMLSGETARNPIGKDHNDVLSMQSRLDALLMVLKTCKGDVCVHPWKVMFPDGSVSSLKDAMDHKYDQFFTSIPKIDFAGCAQGYIRALEGPGQDLGNVPAYDPNHAHMFYDS